MAEQPPQWVLIQKKTFTKWMNGHLKKKQFEEIKEAQTDFSSGINLMNLVNSLYDIPIPPHNKNPKMKPHKLDNVTLALKMLNEAKVKTNFLGAGNLVDEDLKMILGMIWAIILDYQIKGISVDDMNAKEGLLLWCQMKTKGYKDVDVKNFTDSWVDGLGFCALINRFRPDLLDYDKLSKNNAEQNLELAFRVAEEQLGIPRLLDVEDMKNPDEKSVMTYLSEYYHKFSEMEKDLELLTRIKRFLQLVQTTTELKGYYTNKSPQHVKWLNDKIKWLSDFKWKNDFDSCRNALNKLGDYQANEKSTQIGERFTLNGKFQNVNALLGANHMPLYAPPAGADTATIDKLWAQLEELERNCGDKLKAELRTHFENMFKKFDHNGNGSLNMSEFKALLNALGVNPTDAELQQIFANCKTDAEGNPCLSFNDFLQYMMQFISVVDSAEDIKKGFKYIAKQKDYIYGDELQKKINMEQPLYDWTCSPQGLGQFPKNQGYDYVAFTDKAFSGK